MKQNIMDEAFFWALQSRPKEACGLVIIENGKEVFVPCRNISEINSQFIIDPVDYSAAEDRGEIVRVIHSHVNQNPHPSECDKVSCEASGLPWSIVSVPNGDWFHFNPSGYKAPLVGREYSHGVLDCYSLIRDYYKEILNIEIPDFNRDFEWWNKGQNLYEENFKKAGFREVPFETLQKHDVVLIQIMSNVVNHGAVYLGDDTILHHLHKRLSSRDVFGGFYVKHCTKVLRHENN